MIIYILFVIISTCGLPFIEVVDDVCLMHGWNFSVWGRKSILSKPSEDGNPFFPKIWTICFLRSNIAMGQADLLQQTRGSTNTFLCVEGPTTEAVFASHTPPSPFHSSGRCPWTPTWPLDPCLVSGFFLFFFILISFTHVDVIWNYPDRAWWLASFFWWPVEVMSSGIILIEHDDWHHSFDGLGKSCLVRSSGLCFNRDWVCSGSLSFVRMNCHVGQRAILKQCFWMTFFFFSFFFFFF